MPDNLGAILGAITSSREENSKGVESLRQEVNKGFREFRESCQTCNTHLHSRISKVADIDSDEIKKIKAKQNKFIGIILGISFMVSILGPYVFPKILSKLGF